MLSWMVRTYSVRSRHATAVHVADEDQVDRCGAAQAEAEPGNPGKPLRREPEQQRAARRRQRG